MWPSQEATRFQLALFGSTNTLKSLQFSGLNDTGRARHRRVLLGRSPSTHHHRGQADRALLLS